MNKKRKLELLKEQNEYYANHKELLKESNTLENTIEINGLTHIQVDCSADEWIKSVGGVNIEDINLLFSRTHQDLYNLANDISPTIVVPIEQASYSIARSCINIHYPSLGANCT